MENLIGYHSFLPLLLPFFQHFLTFLILLHVNQYCYHNVRQNLSYTYTMKENITSLISILLLTLKLIVKEKILPYYFNFHMVNVFIASNPTLVISSLWFKHKTLQNSSRCNSISLLKALVYELLKIQIKYTLLICFDFRRHKLHVHTLKKLSLQWGLTSFTLNKLIVLVVLINVLD